MFLYEQYKSHLDFINEVKKSDDWQAVLEVLKFRAKEDPMALRKSVIEECNQNMQKEIFKSYWVLFHDAERTIKKLWREPFSYPLFESNLMLMLRVEWVEQNCPAPGKNKQPDPLHTPKAMALWRKLQAKGWIDENLQPTVSDGMASIIASVFSAALNLNPCWPPFEKLWKKVNLSNVYSKSKLRGYYPIFSKDVINALK